MVAIAGSIYLIATAMFSIVATIVGVKLVRLSRQTGHQPERLLGWGLVLTAGLGYGVMMIGIVGGQAAGASESWTVWNSFTLAGWVAHNLGVVCMLLFIVKVFRPEASWAMPLVALMSLVLWGGWLHYVLNNGINGKPQLGYWIAFSVIGTYPLWTTTESFRYYSLMKKRLALGLADAQVTNRFLLWGIASIFAIGSIWIVNIPSFLGLEAGSPTAVAVGTVTMLATAFCGLATVCLYWLTFFPPRWYVARIGAGTES